MNQRLSQMLMSLSGWVIAAHAQAALFNDTPLQPAYQAVLTNQPQLAWQELILNQHKVNATHWLPVKEEILTQTACGGELTSTLNPTNQITLSLIKRYGLVSQGYQIRLSTEHNVRSQKVTLTSPTGSVLLDGRFVLSNQYQELESDELLNKPKAGLFSLDLAGHQTQLLLAIPDETRWLTLQSQHNKSRVKLTLPPTIQSCPPALAQWQWFDQDYNLIGSAIPFKNIQEPIPNHHTQSLKATYLSASVERIEYQQGIRIEYIQRLAIPFSTNGDI